MEKNFSKIKQRILEHLDYMGDSKRTFYKKTGISNGTLDKKTGISEDNLEKYLSTFPEVNIEWLIFGEGEMIVEKSASKVCTQSASKPSYAKNERYNFDNVPGVVREPSVIKFEDDGKSNIVMLNTKAAAGLPTNVDNGEFYENLPHFHLPSLPDVGVPYICLEVDGDSMHPTIKHKDWVIGEQIYDLTTLKEGYVHIVVTNTGVVVKRLLNRVEQRGKIVCQSDNWSYTSYEEDINEVLAVYRSKLILSADFSNMNAQLEIRRDIDQMKKDIDLLKRKK